MRVIDLTHTITPAMPVYPGTEPPVFEPANSYEKDGFKETRLSMFSHTGTHIDPPAHLFAHRTTLDALSAERFVGKALVIDCKGLKDGEAITLKHLEPYGDKVCKAEFLLFNTGYDRHWGTDEYFGDYPCIDTDVLELIIRGGYKGIGFDTIGLDPIADTFLTRHKRLFDACDTINIENLTRLELCGGELFTFACLPLKTADSDGAPARAVAVFED
ncbi:MAG: cyclase family protein [Clostridia bacterium]|nr:cyclase family protein [Clostridia bacterium]